MSDAPQNGNGYSRTNFYISVLGGCTAIAIAIIGAIFWVSGIAGTVNTNSKSIEGLTARMNSLDGIVSSDGIRITTLQRNQNEIETQFCANDIVRNLMHANDLREISLLWQKIYGVPFPTNNAYYPTICNRAVAQ